MLAVITGGSGSGKSEYAESVATSLAKRDGLPLYYIATMRPFGAEGMWRVERHRKLRAGKGFETIECYVNIMSRKCKNFDLHPIRKCLKQRGFAAVGNSANSAQAT